MPTRFVILHHRLENSEHWDLMLEHGEVLLTWQLPMEPTGLDCFPMLAKRIADHRKAYLSHEGPISEDRGTVRRISSGIVRIDEITMFRCGFTIESERWKGEFELVCHSGTDWTLDRTQDPS